MENNKTVKLERKKNAIAGTKAGILLRIYRIVGPFLLRTVFLYTLGVEYLGLDSLFTSIIQVLNIAELGVGTALVFSMYEPISKDENLKICALLKLYKYYYRIIGCVVLTVGIGISPFLPKLIKNGIPSDMNLFILYYMNLFATVLSYWLFSYRNSLFNAYQRTDVISWVGIFTNTIRYVAQILILLIFKNYYAYLFFSIFEQVINNLLIAYYSKKYFPKISATGDVDKKTKSKINRTVKDLFFSKLGQVITNSFDTVVISVFLGLSYLAIYQNYYYIISSIIAMFTILYRACLAGFGNSLLTETQKKNYSDFNKLTYVICFALNFCVSCLLCLYTPFMYLWLRKESLILNYIYVILFTIYFLVYEITMLLEVYKDAAGNWHKDRFRPLIASVVNLITNIMLVKLIGLYGIIISTIISYLFINIPWIYKRLFRDVFYEISAKEYAFKLLKYLFVIIFSACVCANVCGYVKLGNNILQFIFNGVICLIFSCLFFWIFTFKSQEYTSILEYLRRKK